jgi:glycosyltransferase involved in cell wall biosynthesis
VATDSSGVHDYLREGETALLCPAGNVDAMSDAVEACFTNPGLRDRLGSAGLLFAKANCTEHNAVDYFERFLKLV